MSCERCEAGDHCPEHDTLLGVPPISDGEGSAPEAPTPEPDEQE